MSHTELQRMSRQYYSSRTFSGVPESAMDYIASGVLDNASTRRNSIVSQTSSAAGAGAVGGAGAASTASGTKSMPNTIGRGSAQFAGPGHHHSMSVGSLAHVSNGSGYRSGTHGHSASVMPSTFEVVGITSGASDATAAHDQRSSSTAAAVRASLTQVCTGRYRPPMACHTDVLIQVFNSKKFFNSRICIISQAPYFGCTERATCTIPVC